MSLLLSIYRCLRCGQRIQSNELRACGLLQFELLGLKGSIQRQLGYFQPDHVLLLRTLDVDLRREAHAVVIRERGVVGNGRSVAVHVVNNLLVRLQINAVEIDLPREIPLALWFTGLPLAATDYIEDVVEL